jgi:hypothetical protein
MNSSDDVRVALGSASGPMTCAELGDAAKIDRQTARTYLHMMMLRGEVVCRRHLKGWAYSLAEDADPIDLEATIRRLYGIVPLAWMARWYGVHVSVPVRIVRNERKNSPPAIWPELLGALDTPATVQLLFQRTGLGRVRISVACRILEAAGLVEVAGTERGSGAVNNVWRRTPHGTRSLHGWAKQG